MSMSNLKFKYSKTYLLLNLHYQFTSESTPDGWIFFYPDDGGLWISDSDPEDTVDARRVFTVNSDGHEYVEVVERPRLVGDKESLLAHYWQFDHRYPEGVRIVEINSISSAPEISNAH